MVDFEHLYRLTQENNAMLKEILAYVRKQQDADYINADDSKELALNVIGNIIADNLTQDVVNNVKHQFGIKEMKYERDTEEKGRASYQVVAIHKDR